MRTLTFVGILLATAALPGAAVAQPSFGPDGGGFLEDRFAELDSNGDGIITDNEVEAKIAADFATADVDGNGSLSEDEAETYHQARHEERRERRRERRGGGRFERAAGDDGVIDRSEFAERGMERFEMADLDENGVVTETEMRLVGQARSRRQHRRHGNWGEDD